MKVDYNNVDGRECAVKPNYKFFVEEALKRVGEGFRAATERDPCTARDNGEPNVNERRYR
jgi:hypothetical protein